MSAMFQARFNKISESFSLRKIVQNCSKFCQKVKFLQVFLASYMSAVVEAKSDEFQSLLVHESEFKIAPNFAKSFDF